MPTPPRTGGWERGLGQEGELEEGDGCQPRLDGGMGRGKGCGTTGGHSDLIQSGRSNGGWMGGGVQRGEIVDLFGRIPKFLILLETFTEFPKLHKSSGFDPKGHSFIHSCFDLVLVCSCMFSFTLYFIPVYCKKKYQKCKKKYSMENKRSKQERNTQKKHEYSKQEKGVKGIVFCFHFFTKTLR